MIQTKVECGGAGKACIGTHTLVSAGAVESFAYDGNGNLTNWVNGTDNWSYEWDWADRLVKVTKNGTVVLRNWYDANGRRVAKQDLGTSFVYVYDGWESVAVLDGAGQTRESHTRGVGLAGDIGTEVAETLHNGGVMTGTYYAHHNHRGDIVLIRSGSTTAGSYSFSAFGLLTSALGPDLCRFKFSSKERDAILFGFGLVGRFRFWIGHDAVAIDRRQFELQTLSSLLFRPFSPRLGAVATISLPATCLKTQSPILP